ncbi:MAG: hypothetical protein NVS3B20_26360 [Polyangiales bacterium]
MTETHETARDILLNAAHKLGWEPPATTDVEIIAWCTRQIAQIPGGQDRDHALNALREAHDAARKGNEAYARGGLAEALKTCKRPAT